MPDRESPPAEVQQPSAAERDRPLGLDQLSAEQISMFGSFLLWAEGHVDEEGAKQLTEKFKQELCALPEHDLPGATAKLRDLTHCGHEGACSCAGFAAEAVPYLAEQDPDAGFALWRELMTHRESFEPAAAALVETLGKLQLDPERVVELMETYFAAESGDLPSLKEQS